MERTLVLVKPDAVQRGLVGQVIARLEQKGFKIIGMKLLQYVASRSRVRRIFEFRSI